MTDSSNLCSVCGCVISGIGLEHVGLVRLTKNEKFWVPKNQFQYHK